ncbi:MAG: ABC transporter ATP-binding protein, partial [Phormidesmis sp.]
MIKNSSLEVKETTLEASKEPLIVIQGVSKKFCRSLKTSYAYGLKDIASEVLGTSRASNRLRPGEFWAVRDVSLTISRGESLGLIGTNGSGKTTLLKMIGGLIKPDTGILKIHGKIAALIALGAGFNPLLTGRENVYINMSIFGLSKSEIDQKFESVLDFAEIWDAIDAPVRTYSSGMRARLGFSCAIHTNPEILLIDEVLAVGDITFRIKCYRRLAEMRKQGVAFVLVSHSSTAILSNCNLVAYLSKGKLAAFGEAEMVTKQYENDVIGSASTKASLSGTAQSLVTRGLMQSPAQIESIDFLNSDGEKVNVLATGKPAKIKVCFSVSASIENVSITATVKSLSDSNTTSLFLKSSRDIGFVPKIESQKAFATLAFPQCGLVPGSYSMKLNITDNGSYFNILDIVESIKFKVEGTENSSP